MIYSKPTKLLMREFADKCLTSGQIFAKKLAVDWFAKHYPDIRFTTVQMHVEGMAVNSAARKHHPNVKPGSGHDLFFKVGPNQFRLWDSKNDPQPVYRLPPKTNGPEPGTGVVESEDINDEEVEEGTGGDGGSREFAFERDLRNYLAKNLQSLEPGLKPYQDEEFSGVEFPVGGRFIDILAQDSRGGFVVIELKVSRAYDRVMGQLMRYMGWVRKNLADGNQVRGIIVAREIGEDLKLAASLITEVRLVEYEISFKLRPVED
jgi:endonuclease